MPNIIKEERELLKPLIIDLANAIIVVTPLGQNPKGRLEYAINKLAKLILYNGGRLNPGYGFRHDIVYAVHHVADEMKRKELDPYEDRKEIENGVV